MGSTKFQKFPGNAAKNLQKKVPEWGPEKSSGICRPGWGVQAKFWPSPDFQLGPKTPKNGPKWVQNRRFGLKIGPRESYGHFGPVRTGPGPKKSKSMPKNRQGPIFRSNRRSCTHFGSSFAEPYQPGSFRSQLKVCGNRIFARYQDS